MSTWSMGNWKMGVGSLFNLDEETWISSDHYGNIDIRIKDRFVTMPMDTLIQFLEFNGWEVKPRTK